MLWQKFRIITKIFQPLVFENINSLNYIYKEELFMPILILEKFDKNKRCNKEI